MDDLSELGAFVLTAVRQTKEALLAFPLTMTMEPEEVEGDQLGTAQAATQLCVLVIEVLTSNARTVCC